MSDPSPPTVNLEADTALGKFKIASANLNTVATIITLIIVCVVAYVLNAHAGDAKDFGKSVAAELKSANREVAETLKDSNKEMTAILKEMARATREQNCLLSLPQDQRQKNAEVCKRISQ